MNIENQMVNTTNVMVYEILQYANDLVSTDKQKAINFLQTNRTRHIVEYYIKLNYDPSLTFLLPTGPAPYKKNVDVPEGYSLTDLKQEFRRIKIFLDSSLNITQTRREQLWIQMCEGLFWKEADLMNLIKDRRMTDMFPNLTAGFIREALPQLLPAEVAPPVPDDQIKPVNFGEDPSKISEEELIRAAIEEDLKKQGAVATPASTTAKTRKKPGPKPKNAQPEAAPVERKKPGPKPKPKTPVEEQPKERKKPGPKPKPKS